MWMGRKEREQLKTDLYADIKSLRYRIETLELEVRHHVEYSETEKVYYTDQQGGSCYMSKRIGSISLWEMINAIRKHLGLEVSEVKQPKETWKLVKKP